jgi:hypothetical protein
MVLLTGLSGPALPMSATQRQDAIRALDEGDREARVETENVRAYMKLKPGCLSTRDVTDFFTRRKTFADLRERAGTWPHADDALLHTALTVMLDNATADEQLANKMKRRAMRNC